MAEIAVGEAVGEGFRTITRRPLSVLAWGAVQIGFALLPLLVLWPTMGTALDAGRPGASTDTAAVAAQMAQFQGLSMLFNLLQLLVSAILTLAVFRSVLRPGKPRFAYLRLGAPELLFALLLFGAGVVLLVGGLIGFIPAAIGVGTLAVAKQATAAIAVGVSIVLGVICLVIWLALRLSMLAPMLVDEGRVMFGEAWALTRGHFWRLFAIGLLAVLTVLAIEIIVGLVLVAIGFSMVTSVAGGLDHVRDLLTRPQGDLLRLAAPFVALYLLVMIPLSGVALAMMAAPFARAYLQLRPERATDVSETFA